MESKKDKNIDIKRQKKYYPLLLKTLFSVAILNKMFRNVSTY